MMDATESSVNSQAERQVSVRGSLIGTELTGPGSTLDLSKMFYRLPDGQPRPTGIKTVLIDTASGNIYALVGLLDCSGTLINGQETNRTGQLQHAEFTLEQLTGKKITVGEGLELGRGWNSTPVVRTTHFGHTFLNLPEGGQYPESSALDRFLALMPPDIKSRVLNNGILSDHMHTVIRPPLQTPKP